MTFFDESGNRILEFQDPPCSTCPLAIDGRCRGPTTTISLFGRQRHGITCADQEAIVKAHLNLRRNLPRGPWSLQQPTADSFLSFIPVLDRDLPSELNIGAGRLVGIPLGRLITTSGNLRYTTPEGLRHAMGLPANVRICLFMSCDDACLEALWAGSRDRQVWKTIAGLGFEFVTGTSFSVWSNYAPRPEQVLNMERNLASIAHLSAAGVPAIPFIFCVEDEDFLFAGRWLRSHPEAAQVAQYARFYKSQEDFERLLDKMDKLQDEAGRELDFLVQGAAKKAKLEALFSRFPTATVATSKPIAAARSGRLIDEDLGEIPVSRDHIEKPELLRRNLSAFYQVTERLSRRSESKAGEAPLPGDAIVAQGYGAHSVPILEVP